MAKKTRSTMKRQGAPRTPAAPSTSKPAVKVVTLPAERPAFWFGYDVAWAKVLAFRVLFFGLLALDAILQLRHAPRYGAGGFNVAQLPLLDDLGPSRVSYAVAQLGCAYLFAMAALGVATRAVVPIAAALYAWLYFTSQLDGYQHHYLVALLLGIASFVPWSRPADAAPTTPVRSWALRLLLVQLGILYLWAAISKLDPAWLDGRTLSGQIMGPLRSMIDSSVGIKAAARFTILVELALAVTVWMRPAWLIALPLGLFLHTSILVSNLEIGLFAYLMLAMYVLVIPDRVFVRIASLPPFPQLRRLIARPDESGRAAPPEAVRRLIVRGPASDVVTGIAVIGGVALGTVLVALLCRFEHALAVALVLGLLPIAVVAVRRLRGGKGGAAVGLAHLFALLVWIVVDRSTSVAVDYYRFWGGASRRLGEAESSERAYREMIAIAPAEGSGHYQLGRLLLKRGEEKEGLDELHRAQELETARARSYVAEAQYFAGKGRRAEALAKAEEATYAEPTSKEALDLVDSLSGKTRAPGAGSAAIDDDSDQR